MFDQTTATVYAIVDADTGLVVYDYDDADDAALDAAHRNALAGIRGAERDRYVVQPHHFCVGDPRKATPRKASHRTGGMPCFA